MNTHQKGFSLIELIISLAVLTILLTGGVPSLTDVYTQYRADSSIRIIQQTLQFARNQAITLNRTVTACAVIDEKCVQNWQVGLTVFIDTNNNSQLDDSDKILYMTNAFDSKDTVKYNRTSIVFNCVCCIKSICHIEYFVAVIYLVITVSVNKNS